MMRLKNDQRFCGREVGHKHKLILEGVQWIPNYLLFRDEVRYLLIGMDVIIAAISAFYHLLESVLLHGHKVVLTKHFLKLVWKPWVFQSQVDDFLAKWLVVPHFVDFDYSDDISSVLGVIEQKELIQGWEGIMLKCMSHHLVVELEEGKVPNNSIHEAYIINGNWG